MREKTDGQLCRLVKQTRDLRARDDATRELLRRTRGARRWVLTRTKSRYHDDVAALMIALVGETALTYEASRGVPYHTYYLTACRLRWSSFLRREGIEASRAPDSLDEVPDGSDLPLVHVVPGRGDDHRPAADRAAERERLDRVADECRQVLAEIRPRLTPAEYVSFVLRVGYAWTYAEIAAHLNDLGVPTCVHSRTGTPNEWTVKAVDNCLNRTWVKLELPPRLPPARSEKIEKRTKKKAGEVGRISGRVGEE